jgi:NOL1/NOP2/sun family putative RNA methylase
MEAFLGEEYEAFLNSYKYPVSVGLRVNTLKITPDELRKLIPVNLKAIPWCPAGYEILPTPKQVTPDMYPGQHPYHAAGLYYLQDPSAMAVAELIDPQPGEKILDLAAAPGGKATHIAALMNNDGLIVANEIHRRRVWELVKNLERFGVQNAVITNETPERLADHFGMFFDKVLVDAPCSGEGMFRKYPKARLEWSVNQVKGCAKRQLAILNNASRLVKMGGYIIYSTCTFSPEENEGVIVNFFESHKDFELVKPNKMSEGLEGRSDWLIKNTNQDLRNTIRYWPHKSSGEGHFIAKLQRISSEKPQELKTWDPPKIPSFLKRQLINFSSHNLHDKTFVDNLALCKSSLYQINSRLPELHDLRVIRPGWWLGRFKKNRFEPSHALAMGLRKVDVQCVIRLSTDKKTKQVPSTAGFYLKGASLLVDQIEIDCQTNTLDKAEGWVLITLDGFPLGWGRQVGGVIKNYYPHGLRRP